MDLVPAHRPHDLQVILRTRDHAALYDPSSNSLSMQSRLPLSSTSAQSSSALARVRPPDSQQVSPFYPFFDTVAGPSSDEIDDSDSEGASIIPRAPLCPTCFRPWPLSPPLEDGGEHGNRYEGNTPAYIAPNYFRLLAQATSGPGSNVHTRPSPPAAGSRTFADSRESSRSATPDLNGAGGRSYSASTSQPLQQGSEADGYYARFFVEIRKLGKGARGAVFLCQHVLNGNKLGRYAIKKIPVGDHAESLLKSLNEVHLMESLHHPHLIHYQHAWIESCQLSTFAPRVPTLHVLMMAANGGSLADWISARSGEGANASPRPSNGSSASRSGRAPSNPPGAGADEDEKSSSSRASPLPNRARLENLKAAVRQRRAQKETARARDADVPTIGTSTAIPGEPFGGAFGSGRRPTVASGVGVHLLRDEEIYSLMHDLASGLGFLHDRGILHLDIKPANVLLHWDDDALIPRAMLSDFGSSMLLHDTWTRQRSGHTGTMEYMSPETLITDPSTGKLSELSSKADIWSLGMVLHLLLFFYLPYSQVDDVDRLRDEMLAYRGFSRAKTERGPGAGGTRRQRPAKLVQLLERLLDLDPARRPNCNEILQILASGPGPEPMVHEATATESLSLYRRASFLEEWPPSPATVDGDKQDRGPVTRLPRRISLATGADGDDKARLAVLSRRRRIRQRGNCSNQLGGVVADALWTNAGLDLDPTFVRVALAVIGCGLKCLSLDLICLQRGLRPSLLTWYSSLTLALGDIAIASLPKPLDLDLCLTFAMLGLHIAIIFFLPN